MVMICVEKAEKYTMKVQVRDGCEENVSKTSNEKPDVRSQLNGEEEAQQLEVEDVKI